MKKSSAIMKVLSLAVILAFVIPVMAQAQGKANFSGSWVLNAEKSTMPQGGQGGQGGGRTGGMSTLTVKQDANALIVEATRPNRDGGTTPVTTTYALDGKETVSQSNFGDAKSKATWSADGKTLTIVTSRTFERDGQSRTMTSTEEWSMNGSSLQRKTTRTGPNGDVVVTMVYDKK